MVDKRRRGLKFVWSEESGLPSQLQPGKPARRPRATPQWLRDLLERLKNGGQVMDAEDQRQR